MLLHSQYYVDETIHALCARQKLLLYCLLLPMKQTTEGKCLFPLGISCWFT